MKKKKERIQLTVVVDKYKINQFHHEIYNYIGVETYFSIDGHTRYKDKLLDILGKRIKVILKIKRSIIRFYGRLSEYVFMPDSEIISFKFVTREQVTYTP